MAHNTASKSFTSQKCVAERHFYFTQGAADMATVENAKMNSPKIEDSFARVYFHEDSEAAINEQINHEYTMSYVYHAVSPSNM